MNIPSCLCPSDEKKRLPSHLDDEGVEGVGVCIERHRDLNLEDGLVTIFFPAIGLFQINMRLIVIFFPENQVAFLSSNEYCYTGFVSISAKTAS